MGRYDSAFYNSERYYDPTAGSALVSAMRKERRKWHRSSPEHWEPPTAPDPTIRGFLDWYEPNFKCSPDKIRTKRKRVAKQIRIYEFCMKHCDDPNFSIEEVAKNFQTGERLIAQIFNRTGQVTKYTDAWNEYKRRKK